MTQIIPFILAENAKLCIELYQDLFGAELVSRSPFDVEVGHQFNFPDDFDYENSTMHAEVRIFGQSVYLADSLGQTSEKPNVEIVIDFDSEDEIRRIYARAQELGCKVTMPLDQMFWGALYCRIIDPYGIRWQLNYNLSPDNLV